MAIPRILVLLCISLVLAISCKTSKKTPAKSVEISLEVEEFDGFYQKFHSDTIFQKARIKHPLQGQKYDGISRTPWTKDNFELITTKVYDVDTTEYKVYFKKSATEFIQKVWIENSGYLSEYKFKLIGNKWFLVSAVEQDI